MAPAATAQPEEPAAEAEKVSVDINELIIGRPLQFPVFDDKGLLLIAEGSTVTADLKRQLKGRGLAGLEVHQADVDQVTLRGASLKLEDSVSAMRSELSDQLDAFIEQSDLSVKNKGPAVKDQIVFHGKKAYNAKERERLVEQHTQNTEALNGMMSDVIKGGRVDGASVTSMTAAYMTAMSDDSDSLLTVAAEASMQKELSDHCLQMSVLGMAIGAEMGLDATNLRSLSLAGLVHDWGMLRVSSEIRELARPLTLNEFLDVQKHPIYALDMLQSVSGIPNIVPTVCYQVHERVNGTGYPRRRSESTIHLFARILQVADAYVALTSPRPWRLPMMPYAAMECIVRHSKVRNHDPDVVRALLCVLSLFPVGSYVTLSDGSVARVLRRNHGHYTQPIVQRIQDSKGNVQEDAPESIVDLTEVDVQIEQALPTPGRKEIGLLPEHLRL